MDAALSGRENGPMPQSLSHALLHVVFSTKGRDAMIGSGIRQDLHAYLGGTLNGVGCPPVRVGGTEDHIHGLLILSRTITIAGVIKEMKQQSSVWMKEHGEPRFAWQAGYGAFSVSPSKAEEVAAYIANQEMHHRQVTFQEEFRAFLTRHGIPYDERYVWD
jgi:REP element-mobilizing transposase RayT